MWFSTLSLDEKAVKFNSQKTAEAQAIIKRDEMRKR